MRQKLAILIIAVLGGSVLFTFSKSADVRASNRSCPSTLLANLNYYFTYDGVANGGEITLTLRGVLSKSNPSSDCIDNYENYFVTTGQIGDTINNSYAGGYWKTGTVSGGWTTRYMDVTTYTAPFTTTDINDFHSRGAIGTLVGQNCVLISDEGTSWYDANSKLWFSTGIGHNIPAVATYACAT
jgi:hypothetical protein